MGLVAVPSMPISCWPCVACFHAFGMATPYEGRRPLVQARLHDLAGVVRTSQPRWTVPVSSVESDQKAEARGSRRAYGSPARLRNVCRPGASARTCYLFLLALAGRDSFASSRSAGVEQASCAWSTQAFPHGWDDSVRFWTGHSGHDSRQSICFLLGDAMEDRGSLGTYL